MNFSDRNGALTGSHAGADLAVGQRPAVRTVMRELNASATSMPTDMPNSHIPVDQLFKTVRSNLVQSIRAFRVHDLQAAAQFHGHHFLYANLASAQSKQDVLDMIAAQFTFPAHFGKNLDALYDCMTDLVHKSGQQAGFVVVLEQIPDNPRFDREAREQLLEVFRDAAEYWGERRIPFRCFYSFQ